VLESADFFTQTPDGDRMKLGLGSSAAVTACLTAALAVAGGADLDAPEVRAGIFERALKAHRAASGGGSGADVAACTFGGLLRVSLGPGPERAVRVEPLPTPLRTLHLIFAGASADTRQLLGTVRGARERLPPGVFTGCTTAIDAARRAAEPALTGDALDGPALAAAVRQGREAVEGLGIATGTPLTGPGAVRRAVADLAVEVGGAWKTTGAGGGDLYWLYVPATVPAGTLAEKAAARGLPLWSLPVARQGVHLLGV
jgi:phosphomevalonate kinase